MRLSTATTALNLQPIRKSSEDFRHHMLWSIALLFPFSYYCYHCCYCKEAKEKKKQKLHFNDGMKAADADMPLTPMHSEAKKKKKNPKKKKKERSLGQILDCTSVASPSSSSPHTRTSISRRSKSCSA